MRLLLKSSTAQPLVFLMVQSADHVTGLTGATVTVTLSKAGAAFGAAAGAVSEIANGWYKVAGNATDTGTLGALALHASATGGDPTDIYFDVVAFDPQDGVHLGITGIPNAAAGAVGGLPLAVDTSGRVDVLKINGTSQTARDIGASVLLSVGTGTGQVNLASGKVPATLASTDVTGNVASDLQTIKTQAVTAAAGVTFPTSIGTSTFAGGAVSSVTGNVGGNVVGSVASVASAIVLPTIPTDWIAAAGVKADAVTKIQAGLATPTNITAGTITTVTNLTNAATAGDLTATMKTSIAGLTIARVTLVDTITTYTGNTKQTGDIGKFKATYFSGTDQYVIWTLDDSGNAVAPAASALAPGAAMTLTSDYDAAKTAAPTADAVATAVLTLDWTGVTGEASFSTLNSLRFLRNKWAVSGSTLTVYEEDGSTSAWTHTLATDPSAVPITGVS